MQLRRIVFFLNSSESDGDRRITDKCLTGGSRIHHAFYIILLDNFMGPTLGEEEKKGGGEGWHSSKLCTPALLCPQLPPPLFSLPCDLPQLGLFYADLPGERMGTAVGLCCRMEGEKRGQKLENRGGPVFVAFGSAFSLTGQVCEGMKTNAL